MIEDTQKLEAGLEYLAEAIEEYRRQGRPTSNDGSSFSNDVFSMRAYCWSDCCKCEDLADGESNPDCDTCRPNFEYKDFWVKWYKYCGRGMEMSRPIDFKEFSEIIRECVNSLRYGDK